MIKTLYCHNGTCIFQCKVIISSVTSFEKLPSCVMSVPFQTPNWKVEDYTHKIPEDK